MRFTCQIETREHERLFTDGFFRFFQHALRGAPVARQCERLEPREPQRHVARFGAAGATIAVEIAVTFSGGPAQRRQGTVSLEPPGVRRKRGFEQSLATRAVALGGERHGPLSSDLEVVRQQLARPAERIRRIEAACEAGLRARCDDAAIVRRERRGAVERSHGVDHTLPCPQRARAREPSLGVGRLDHRLKLGRRAMRLRFARRHGVSGRNAALRPRPRRCPTRRRTVARRSARNAPGGTWPYRNRSRVRRTRCRCASAGAGARRERAHP